MWKHMDRDAVRAGSEHLRVQRGFISREQIDLYVDYLQKFVLDLIDHTVPLRRQTAAGPVRQRWWNPEVERLVRAERQARRRGAPDEEIRQINREKREALRKARRADFRQAVHDAKDRPGSIWKLARWGKERSHQPPEPPTVPTLVYKTSQDSEAKKATTFQEKVEAFGRQFFPPVPEADLGNMEGYAYPEEVEVPPRITEDMVGRELKRAAPNKAPGPDGIPNGFLQAMGSPLIRALQELAQACWDWQYFPRACCTARTVAMRKPDKGNYTEPKSWRPIALLNTIGKVVEAVTARYLQDVAERWKLLPETQMGARKNRSTETALDWLLSQVRTVLREEGAVATVLSLDMSGAYDNVVRKRLVHILKARGVPASIVGWVDSFMTGRSTTLSFEGQESDPIGIPAGIPQGSPISPILFLFYNAELLEICNPPREPVQGMGFVDDVNLIAYGHTTESNCAGLLRVHSRCLQWAKRHGAKFAPDKYHLIHVSGRRRRFNMEASIELGSVTVKPEESVRVLGVHLDTGLRWKKHLASIKSRMTTYANALTRLTGSTWGFPLIQGRQVYNAIVRPAMTYGAIAWHQPTADGRKATRGITPKLEVIQNKCLRVISGAFRATPVRALETLTFTPPLDLALSARVAAYRERTRETGLEQLILKACSKVRRHLAQSIRATEVAIEIVGHPVPMPLGWTKEWAQEREAGEQAGRQADRQVGRGASIRKTITKKWVKRWEEGTAGRHYIVDQPPHKGVLDRYRDLHKAESAILVQLTTGKIGLASFLHKAKVPGYDSPQCGCGQGQETPAHITVASMVGGRGKKGGKVVVTERDSRPVPTGQPTHKRRLSVGLPSSVVHSCRTEGRIQLRCIIEKDRRALRVNGVLKNNNNDAKTMKSPESFRLIAAN